MLTSIDTNVKISDDQKEMSLILNKFEHKEPSIQQLAEHLGFNADEQKMIKLFWEPAFNKGWIYLSDEIILGQLTKSTSKDALRHFYNKVFLSDDYVENIDYKKITKKDKLVKMYEEFDSQKFANQKDDENQESNEEFDSQKFANQNFDEDKSSAKNKDKTKQGAKKYYAITGKTYKDLLQKSTHAKGKTTRDYYHKVEDMARFMKDYISVLHTYILQKQMDEQRRQMDEQQKLMDAQKKNNK